jgi:glycosyltransferase 2 family protein
VKSALRLAIGFGISAVLLLLLIRSVDPDSLRSALSAADWRLLAPAVGLFFLGAWLRSVRWGLLLPEYHVPVWTLFKALIVGFTVNNLLPVRMGEIARAYLLARWSAVPYGATLASLVVECVLDGLSLAALLLLALRFVPAPPYLIVASVLIGGAFFAGAVILFLAAWRASVIISITDRVTRMFPERVHDLAVRLATSFARALASIHGTSRLLRVLALSLVAWCCELSLFWVLMPGFGIPASAPLALLVGSAANFATLVPSSPGYVGTFDGALITVLRDTADVEAGIATAYAIVVHAVLFVPVVLAGLLVLWRSQMTFTQITHRPEPSATTPAESDLVPAA